jgi:hypothetical protein
MVLLANMVGAGGCDANLIKHILPLRLIVGYLGGAHFRRECMLELWYGQQYSTSSVLHTLEPCLICPAAAVASAAAIAASASASAAAPWFSMPHLADDTYHRNFAQYVKVRSCCVNQC